MFTYRLQLWFISFKFLADLKWGSSTPTNIRQTNAHNCCPEHHHPLQSSWSGIMQMYPVANNHAGDIYSCKETRWTARSTRMDACGQISESETEGVYTGVYLQLLYNNALFLHTRLPEADLLILWCGKWIWGCINHFIKCQKYYELL